MELLCEKTEVLYTAVESVIKVCSVVVRELVLNKCRLSNLSRSNHKCAFTLLYSFFKIGVINRSIYDIFPPLTNLNYNFIIVESCQSFNYRDDCPRLNAARYGTAIITNTLCHINIGIAIGTLYEIDPGL